VKGGKSLPFKFFTLQQATDNFSDLNKLGEGGFGPVYKVLLFVLIIISLKSQHYLKVRRKYVQKFNFTHRAIRDSVECYIVIATVVR
jgi:hypothetical protein